MADCASMEADEAQRRFVSILKEYPILLNVSMIPEIRKQRTAALTEIQRRVELEMKIPMSESQIAKKIQNLKSRIKKRNELMKAGMETFYLKDWQKDFSDFMERESQQGLRVGWVEQGAVTAECLRNSSSDSENHLLNKTISELDSYSNEDETFFKILPQEATLKQNPLGNDGSSTSCPEMKTRLPETEETKKLSTYELKRLVLLEQLKFYRDADKFVLMKIDQCKKSSDGK